MKQDKPEDLNDVWKQLNTKTDTDTLKSEGIHQQTQTVKINRTYEFAGQVIT